MIYLDYAAATPLDERVVAVMKPYFTQKFYNPSATYLNAKEIKDDLQTARGSVAGVLGSKPSEIYFTAGGTEANNMAIIGILQEHPKAHVVTTALEHESVLEPLAFMAERGYSFTEIVPKTDGIIDPTRIAKAITEKTVLVSVMYANNEIGTIQPIKQIAKKIDEVRLDRIKNGNNLPLYFHTDACQAGNYLNLMVHSLGVDLMTLNGGKIYGPKQSGVLYIASHVKLTPIIHGGGQEHNIRSGTENTAGIIGFAKSLEIAVSMRSEETKRLQTLQKQFIDNLLNKIPQLSINGSLKYRLPNNIHVTIPDSDNERLLFGLDELGIQCATGSACSASSDESSHVLHAIGLTDESARSSLRFSMGRNTTKKDIDDTVQALVKLTS